MRKKTYAVQAPESVYKILSEMSEKMNIPKMKAIEIMANSFVENREAKPEVILEAANTETPGCLISPCRIFKNAD